MFVRLYADNYRCLSNFTLMLEPLSVLLGTNGLLRQNAERNLSQGGLPSFRALEFVPSGDAKIVQCIFQAGRSTSTFRLDELSSGQIALIILETALAVADDRGGVLLLDEPGTFLV